MPNSWYDPTLHEAENWGVAAAWKWYQNWGGSSATGVAFWYLQKFVPIFPGTPSSIDAYLAGMEGLQHQYDTPTDLKKWCSGCSK
jgi:hypothetical protein